MARRTSYLALMIAGRAGKITRYESQAVRVFRTRCAGTHALTANASITSRIAGLHLAGVRTHGAFDRTLLRNAAVVSSKRRGRANAARVFHAARRPTALIVRGTGAYAFHQRHTGWVVRAPLTGSKAMRGYAGIATGVAQAQIALGRRVQTLHTAMLGHTSALPHQRVRHGYPPGMFRRALQQTRLIIRRAGQHALHQRCTRWIVSARGAFRHAMSRDTSVAIWISSR